MLVPEQYPFVAPNTSFIALVYLSTTLQSPHLTNQHYFPDSTFNESTLFSGPYKTYLDSSPPSIIFQVDCKQSNRFNIKVSEQPSSLPKTTCTFLIIRQLLRQFQRSDIHHSQKDFKSFDENKNVVFPEKLSMVWKRVSSL